MLYPGRDADITAEECIVATRKARKWGVIFRGDNLSMGDLLYCPPSLTMESAETRAVHEAILAAFGT
jgi:hypothetical protein